MKVKKTVKQYLKAIYKKLPCDFAVKAAILNDLRERIMEEYPEGELTVEILQNRFGTPDEFADGFDQMTRDERLLKKAKKFRIRAIAITAVCAFAIALLLYLLINTISSSSNNTLITNYQNV